FGLNVGIQEAGFEIRRDYGDIAGPSVLTGPTTHKPRSFRFLTFTQEKGSSQSPAPLSRTRALKLEIKRCLLAEQHLGRVLPRLVKAGGSRPSFPSDDDPDEGIDELSWDESSGRLVTDCLEILLDAMLMVRRIFQSDPLCSCQQLHPDAEVAIASDPDVHSLCQQLGQVKKCVSCSGIVPVVSKRKIKVMQHQSCPDPEVLTLKFPNNRLCFEPPSVTDAKAYTQGSSNSRDQDDTLQAIETIQRFWDGLPGSLLTLQTRPVEVVISCLAISKAEEWWTAGLLRSRLFRAFTCVNTTHWGIKIGESYYDLKRGPGFFGPPEFKPVRSLEERDECPVMQSIPIGATHFSDDDLDKVGYDLMRHAPFYHCWFDNCQGFAVNDFATRILCPCCDAQGRLLDISKGCYLTPEYRALASIKDLRLVEYIHMLNFIGVEFVTVLMYVDVITEERASFYLQTFFVLAMGALTSYLVELYKANVKAAWEERLQRQAAEPVPRSSNSSDEGENDQTLGSSTAASNAETTATGLASAISS
ncbi:hypothetical protein BT69DRAFT_1306073, partial [Atractiella rhizophila]